MNETSKMYEIRKTRGDFDKYLNGNGIDIGGGPDCLKVENGTVRLWDLDDGDGRYLNGVENESLDFVYSSHCLEHMTDVKDALKNWCSKIKKGGHLYVIIPDFMLYEKGYWPSRFNGDHKFSFSYDLSKDQVGRQNHYLMSEIFEILKENNMDLITHELEKYFYSETLHKDIDQTLFPKTICQIYFVARKKALN